MTHLNRPVSTTSDYHDTVWTIWSTVVKHLFQPLATLGDFESIDRSIRDIDQCNELDMDACGRYLRVVRSGCSANPYSDENEMKRWVWLGRVEAMLIDHFANEESIDFCSNVERLATFKRTVWALLVAEEFDEESILARLSDFGTGDVTDMDDDRLLTTIMPRSDIIEPLMRLRHNLAVFLISKLAVERRSTSSDATETIEVGLKTMELDQNDQTDPNTGDSIPYDSKIIDRNGLSDTDPLAANVIDFFASTSSYATLSPLVEMTIGSDRLGRRWYALTDWLCSEVGFLDDFRVSYSCFGILHFFAFLFTISQAGVGKKVSVLLSVARGTFWELHLHILILRFLSNLLIL